MSARDQILGDVKRAKPAPKPSARFGRQALVPPRFVRDAPDLTALFVEKLHAVSASTEAVADMGEVPGAIASWLNERELPSHLLVASEAFLQNLSWGDAGLEATMQVPDPLRPATIVSGALAGVAETGSLAFSTGGESRPSHNVLAESHIVVLRRAQILPTLEDVWRQVSAGGLPRSLAFVTGPSRTADIEMTIELGVHGAVRLHLILVG